MKSTFCTVDGPITGGRYDRPFASSIVDLGEYGYEENEYFVSGTATRYVPAPGTALTPDGRWQVVTDGTDPYRTRILVRRPSADRFNGVVVVEFMQEYFGCERDTNYRWYAEILLREGFAWVGASLHHEGIDVPGRQEISLGGYSFTSGPSLVEWDPERYGSLEFPHSDLCYDVLSQIARTVGPDRPAQPADPLGGLIVQRVFAAGNTIAADRLRHYINAVHPGHRVFEGFFLQDLSDSGVALAEGIASPPDLWVRTDVGVPTVVLNTTTAAMDATRQEEGEHIRFWEPAGSSHTTGPYMARVATANARDLSAGTPLGDPGSGNTLPLQYVGGAAFAGLRRWAEGGEPIARFPVIERAGDENGEATAVFDKSGNVAGGLRTPWVDVPVARYDWRGESLGGSGATYPYTERELRLRYGTPAVYHQRFAAATRAAVRSGVLLPDEAERAIAESHNVSW